MKCLIQGSESSSRWFRWDGLYVLILKIYIYVLDEYIYIWLGNPTLEESNGVVILQGGNPLGETHVLGFPFLRIPAGLKTMCGKSP